MTKSTRRPSFTFGSRVKPSVRENRTSQFRLTARLPPPSERLSGAKFKILHIVKPNPVYFVEFALVLLNAVWRHFLSIEPQTASVDRCAFITLLYGGRALHAAAGLFYLIAVAVNL